MITCQHRKERAFTVTVKLPFVSGFCWRCKIGRCLKSQWVCAEAASEINIFEEKTFSA